MKKPNFHNVKLDEDVWSSLHEKEVVANTNEGIEIQNVYDELDMKQVDHLHDYPGIAPFTRGPYPTMYVTRPWTVRQYAGFSTAEESNAFYRRNLAMGQKGLSV